LWLSPGGGNHDVLANRSPNSCHSNFALCRLDMAIFASHLIADSLGRFMRILIVEDNDKLANLMASLLRDNFYSVDRVANVDDARAAVELVEYDLILLDLSLPDGDGGEILLSLRRKGQATRILVATARADVVQRVETLNDGADDYLVKPFSFDELLARIRALLRRPCETKESVLTVGRVALDTQSLTLRVTGNVTPLHSAFLITVRRGSAKSSAKRIPRC
jgi:DNA-binding response OmpR family regulator